MWPFPDRFDSVVWWAAMALTFGAFVAILIVPFLWRENRCLNRRRKRRTSS